MEIKIGNRVWITGDFEGITDKKVYKVEDLDSRFVLIFDDLNRHKKIPIENVDNSPSIRDERFSFFEIIPNEKEKWGVRVKMDGLIHIGCRSYYPKAYLKMCKFLLKNRNSKYECGTHKLTFVGTEEGLDDRGDVIPWEYVEQVVKHLNKSKIKFEDQKEG